MVLINNNNNLHLLNSYISFSQKRKYGKEMIVRLQISFSLLSAKLSISQIWRQNFLQPLSKWGTNLERKVAFSGNDRNLGVVWSPSWEEKKLTVAISVNVNHSWSDWRCRNHDWNTLPPVLTSGFLTPNYQRKESAAKSWEAPLKCAELVRKWKCN